MVNVSVAKNDARKYFTSKTISSLKSMFVYVFATRKWLAIISCLAFNSIEYITIENVKLIPINQMHTPSEIAPRWEFDLWNALIWTAQWASKSSRNLLIFFFLRRTVDVVKMDRIEKKKCCVSSNIFFYVNKFTFLDLICFVMIVICYWLLFDLIVRVLFNVRYFQ